MNGPTVDHLYHLLPSIYRLRDTAQGEPLRALLAAIEDDLQALKADTDQLYHNWFIETCDEWVVPYIGDLLGVHGFSPLQTDAVSQRAYVANTLAYRRRKGTAAVLEQLARDVTGWPAHVVEYFQLLSTTQHMNHLRPTHVRTPDLRYPAPLGYLGGPFESISHSADVRRIDGAGGRHNIPNIGIFLWRLQSYPLPLSPAFQLDARRYLFSPLGNSAPLFHLPQTEREITQLATPINVPIPIERQTLRDALEDDYGSGKSLLIHTNGTAIPVDQIVVCNLSDVENGAWAHLPQDQVAIDPTLGRLAFPATQPPPTDVQVSFHYGFSADLGGGTYARADAFETQTQIIQRVPAPHPTIQGATNALGDASGVVEINDNGRYDDPPSLDVPADRRLELRAADSRRPHIALSDTWTISGGDTAEVTLNGLIISGGTLRIGGELRRLRLRHCTLVPGLSLLGDGSPQAPDVQSLVIESPTTQVEIDHCIIGGIFAAEGANVRITNSIVDATAETKVAYAALDATGAGGPLSIENSTIIGKVHTVLMAEVTNTIFRAKLAEVDTWTTAIEADRRQQGCVRFSFVPDSSRTPQRYRCQPDLAAQAPLDEVQRRRLRARLIPLFTSLRYGHSGYGQLHLNCPQEIRTGAEDGAEMGAFSHLKQPQREANLRASLENSLRFGLEAGIFYVT